MINDLRLNIPHLFIGLFVYLLIAQTINAAPLSLSIDPPIITINAVPPTTVKSSISIQNKEDTQVVLQIEIKAFKAKGENGELEYLSEVSQIFENIQIMDAGIPIQSITLNPKQQKNLDLNINISEDISISDYYFSVIFVSANSSPIESNSSLNQIGVVTNVLLSVGSLETPKSVLEEFSSNLFFERGPVPFTIRLRNEGVHFIKPKGEIVIKNIFGQSIGKLDLTSVNVLSDSIRAIPNNVYMQDLRLKESLDTKEKNSFDFKHPIALWKENFLLGFYTATLNISSSDEGPAITKAIHFFALPYQALIIIVFIAIAAIVVRKRVKIYLNKDRT